MRWHAKELIVWHRVWAWVPTKIIIDGTLKWVWWEAIEVRQGHDCQEVRMPVESDGYK